MQNTYNNYAEYVLYTNLNPYYNRQGENNSMILMLFTINIGIKIIKKGSLMRTVTGVEIDVDGTLM